MMFITPTPPMPSVRVPIKISSTCRPMVMPSMTGRNSLAAEHLNRFLVGGRELLARGNRRQDLRLGTRLELRRDGFEHQHVGLFGVPEIARRGVGNPGRLIVAGEIVAELNLAVHDADNGKAHAADHHRFADRGTTAE